MYLIIESARVRLVVDHLFHRFEDNCSGRPPEVGGGGVEDLLNRNKSRRGRSLKITERDFFSLQISERHN
jgi:hypothetical protein